MIVKIDGMGFTGDYDHQVENRSFVFRFDVRLGGHILRVPYHLWMQDKARLAHDLMGRKFRWPMIVLIEFTPLEAASAPAANTSPVIDEQQPATGDAGDEGNTENSQPNGGERASSETTGNAPDDQPTENVQKAPLMYGEMPLHQAVSDLVKDGALRIKAVAHQLDKPEDDVRAAIEDPASLAEIAQGGWVRLKVPEEPAAA